MGILGTHNDVIFRATLGSCIARLSAQHLARLIADVAQGYRIYDLMMIRRPNDLLDFLTVTVEEGWHNLQESPLMGDEDKEHLRKHEALSFRGFVAGITDDDEVLLGDWRIFLDKGLGQHLLSACMEAVQQAQEAVRQSSDLLTTEEIKLFDEYRHPIDQALRNSGVQCVSRGAPRTIQPAYPTSLYAIVERMFRSPSLGSMVYRGDADFSLLKLACAECARRDDDFVVNVLDIGERWASASETFEWDKNKVKYLGAPAWIRRANFWQDTSEDEESYRSIFSFLDHDLVIDAWPKHSHVLLSSVLDPYPEDGLYPCPKVVVSLVEPDIAVEGFKWFRHRDGFTVGATRNHGIVEELDAWVSNI